MDFLADQGAYSMTVNLADLELVINTKKTFL